MTLVNYYGVRLEGRQRVFMCMKIILWWLRPGRDWQIIVSNLGPDMPTAVGRIFTRYSSDCD